MEQSYNGTRSVMSYLISAYAIFLDLSIYDSDHSVSLNITHNDSFCRLKVESRSMPRFTCSIKYSKALCVGTLIGDSPFMNTEILSCPVFVRLIK